VRGYIYFTELLELDKVHLCKNKEWYFFCVLFCFIYLFCDQIRTYGSLLILRWGTCLDNLNVFSVPRRSLSWRVHLAEWTQYLAQWIQQRKISQTERFRTKNALEVWKQIRVWPYVFYDDATQF